MKNLNQCYVVTLSLAKRGNNHETSFKPVFINTDQMRDGANEESLHLSIKKYYFIHIVISI